MDAPGAANPAPTDQGPGVLGPALALGRRELVRFFRQKGRVIGAVGTPLFIWAFLGLGLGKNFQAQGAGGSDYLVYFYPGMIAMVILFTAIFSAISVIQDRTEGFLQAVLVAPAPRLAIVLGKILGGTAIASIQGVFLLVIAPLLGVPFHALGFVLAALVIVLTSLALSALGFLFAWGTASVQAFHGVMNLVLFPMWLLSGAFFPPEGWLGIIMRANPLTYGLAAIRRCLYFGSSEAFAGTALPGLGLSIAVVAGFAALCLGLSAMRVGRQDR
jgi:ABC-2 type transport system permease protein